MKPSKQLRKDYGRDPWYVEVPRELSEAFEARFPDRGNKTRLVTVAIQIALQCSLEGATNIFGLTTDPGGTGEGSGSAS